MQLLIYVTYLLISLAITVWVGRSLNKNGKVFLVEIFRGRNDLADSVNHLLLVGFYLINIGFVTLAMHYGPKAKDWVSAAELLSIKIGLVLLLLGVMHFFNIYLLVKFRDSKVFKAISPWGNEPAA